MKDGKFEVGDKVRDTVYETEQLAEVVEVGDFYVDVRYEDGSRGRYVGDMRDALELVAPPASSTDHDIQRLIGVKGDDVRFMRDGDMVEIIVYDENGDGLGKSLHIEQLRKMIEVIEGEAK